MRIARLLAIACFAVLGTVLAGCSGQEPASPGSCLAADTPDRAEIPAGTYLIGTNARYREEGPPREVETQGFAMDTTEVTNAEFARFVEATGYVTIAERPADPASHPDLDPVLLVPGSAVFGVDARQGGFWWSFVPGASWRAPFGPDSGIEGMDDYPVVHVAYQDAAAYAQWAGARLPTEDEWEIAARGGIEGAEFVWGEEFRPDGAWRANTWQGPFPAIDLGDDGHAGLAPAGCYPANEYGLHDMAGNVWEWTASPFDESGASGTIRGGSYLCAPGFCARFRPAARQPQERDFSASHIGFRTVRDEARP